jgi:hypothetical protein
MDQITNGALAPLEDPVGALLRLATEIVAFKDFLAGRVAELREQEWRFTDDRGAEQLRAELSLYERALDRTARVLVDVNKLGLEERALRNAERVAERQGDQIAEVIKRILEAIQDRIVYAVDETTADRVRAAWQGWVGEIVPRELVRMAEQEASRG